MWSIANEDPLGIVLKRTARGVLHLGWATDDPLSQEIQEITSCRPYLRLHLPTAEEDPLPSSQPRHTQW